MLGIFLAGPVHICSLSLSLCSSNVVVVGTAHLEETPVVLETTPEALEAGSVRAVAVALAELRPQKKTAGTERIAGSQPGPFIVQQIY